MDQACCQTVLQVGPLSTMNITGCCANILKLGSEHLLPKQADHADLDHPNSCIHKLCLTCLRSFCRAFLALFCCLACSAACAAWSSSSCKAVAAAAAASTAAFADVCAAALGAAWAAAC